MRIFLFLAAIVLIVLNTSVEKRPVFQTPSSYIRLSDTIPPSVARNSWWVDSILRHVPYKQYLAQSDSVGKISWLLVCPENSPCRVYQSVMDVDFVHALKFRPGTLVHIAASGEQVRLASFDDFNSSAAQYPVVIFNEPYYLVFHKGFWTYAPESALTE